MESSLDLSWQSQLLEQSVMSKSKPLRVKSWQAAWKRRDWIKRLFGRILKPSTANLGVESWIASLADIPASRLVLLGKSSEIKTQDTSGQKSNDSSKKSSHQFASSKMSEGIYDLDLKKSQMTYGNWVIKLRRACLQRQKSVLHIKGKGSSFWPTATVSDAAMQKARSPEKMIRKDGRNVLRTPSLAETILQPTDFPYSKEDLKNQQHGLPYQLCKRLWPTVRTSSANGASSKEVEAGNPKQRLEVMTANWATPTARDWKDNASADVPTNSLLGRQAPRTMKDGIESQMTLNPRFTEWLMGWPIGWTESELVATEWFRWLQLMRGELLRMEYISQKIN